MPIFFTRPSRRLTGVVCTALGVLGVANSGSATPINALSFVQVNHGFVVSGGSVPNGVASSNHSLNFGAFGATTSIDAPDAVLSVDETFTQIGCASCDPLIPSIREQENRTDRADPTEFARAQHNVSIEVQQDEGTDVAAFAVGAYDVTRTGLAQARIVSSPAPAEALSQYNSERTTTFENLTDADISFTIAGFFDALLTSRYSGDDGIARATTIIDIAFSGLAGSTLTYIPLDTYLTDVAISGATASQTNGVFSQPSGIQGLQFTAATTAIGDGGFNVAQVEASHEYLFALTLGAGRSVDMTFGYGQSNFVAYTPDSMAPVPLPAGAWLLITALSLLGLRGATRRSA